MGREELIQLLFKKGREYNIKDLEVYMEENSSLNFNIYEGELDEYSVSKEEILSLRGIYKNKMGYSYTEKMTESSLEEVLHNLIEYAENNGSEYIEVLASPNGQYKNLKEKINGLDKYTEEEKIKFLKDIEKEAFSLDTRITTVDSCEYVESTKTVFIKNTRGLELEDSHTTGLINLSVVAKDGDDVQTGNSYINFNTLEDKYKSLLVKESVSDALNMLGAASIESGNYEVILRNNVAANLFSAFSPIFLGDIVQRNLSLMKGKIGEKVGSDILNIVEDPSMSNGRVCRAFDDEGTITYSKYLIEKGILNTFLHNNRTAEKEGLESTGNGFRVSHKGSIGVLPTNMYIEPGDITLNHMINTIEKGIIITDIQGLHAGVNPMSGDFSLSSNGFLIEKGEIFRPISQITIAGNFYNLLKDISAIGNDAKTSFPYMNYFNSPSIKINSLTIAGK